MIKSYKLPKELVFANQGFDIAKFFSLIAKPLILKSLFHWMFNVSELLNVQLQVFSF